MIHGLPMVLGTKADHTTVDQAKEYSIISTTNGQSKNIYLPSVPAQSWSSSMKTSFSFA